jgi:hypothetical protein
LIDRTLRRIHFCVFDNDDPDDDDEDDDDDNDRERKTSGDDTSALMDAAVEFVASRTEWTEIIFEVIAMTTSNLRRIVNALQKNRASSLFVGFSGTKIVDYDSESIRFLNEITRLPQLMGFSFPGAKAPASFKITDVSHAIKYSNLFFLVMPLRWLCLRSAFAFGIAVWSVRAVSAVPILVCGVSRRSQCGLLNRKLTEFTGSTNVKHNFDS